ncbi:MAG: hypothetical protein ACXVEF_00180 [Polyangiales bacterium]
MRRAALFVPLLGAACRTTEAPIAPETPKPVPIATYTHAFTVDGPYQMLGIAGERVLLRRSSLVAEERLTTGVSLEIGATPKPIELGDLAFVLGECDRLLTRAEAPKADDALCTRRMLFLGSGKHLDAFEGGKPKFSLDAPCSLPRFLAHDDALVVVCEGVDVHDANTGKLVSRFAIGRAERVALGDEALYTVGEGTLTAHSLHDGHVLFTRAMRAVDVGAAGRELFVCTEGGVLHALDRTGATTFTFGLGACSNYPKLPSFHVSPRGVVALRLGSDNVNAHVDAFVHGAPEPPRRRVTVSGHAKPNALVFVDDDRTKADAKGSFTIEHETRGAMRIDCGTVKVLEPGDPTTTLALDCD